MGKELKFFVNESLPMLSLFLNVGYVFIHIFDCNTCEAWEGEHQSSLDCNEAGPVE